MLIRKWELLPAELQTPEVKPYYDILVGKKGSFLAKRVFDFFMAFVLLILLSPVFLVLAVAIRIDSPGPVFFRQKRITQYGKTFRIFKFRTMVRDAEKLGTQVTAGSDRRITRVGRHIRNCRLDELPQLLNILAGDMSFVGTRPEVEKYVERYSPEMMATLLLPAGVTSLASIEFKDEAQLLTGSSDLDELYVQTVLPRKMEYNLQEIREFGFWREMWIIVKTFFAVL